MKQIIRVAATIVSAVFGIIFLALAIVMLTSILNYHAVMAEVLAEESGTTMDMIRDITESCGLYFGFAFILLCLSAAMFTQPAGAAYPDKAEVRKPLERPKKEKRERPSLSFRKKNVEAAEESSDSSIVTPVEPPRDIRKKPLQDEPGRDFLAELAAGAAVKTEAPEPVMEDRQEQPETADEEEFGVSGTMDPNEAAEDIEETENEPECGGTAILDNTEEDDSEADAKENEKEETENQEQEVNAQNDGDRNKPEEFDEVKALLNEALEGGFVTEEDVRTGNLTIEVIDGERKIRKKSVDTDEE